MFLVGLTGGIAAGKSTVAGFLEELGAQIIDADQVAREVVAPGTDGLRLVEAEFGQGVVSADGSLSREKMAAVVFANPERRKDLEAILHPLIAERTRELIGQSHKQVVIYVVPLLVEAAVDYPFDLIVTVESGVDIQISRLMETRGLSLEEANSRIAAQASEAQRVSVADVRIDGAVSIGELKLSVHLLWEKIQELIVGKVSRGEN